MPQISTLTLNDGLATPVARTFVPSARYPVTVWEAALGSFPSAYPKITAQGGKNPKTGLYRGKMGIAVPKVDATGLILNTSRINIEVIHAANSDLQQRKDTYAYSANAVGVFLAFLRDMEGFY